MTETTGSGFLKRAYRHAGAEETRKLYQDWSKSYDAEVAENGYATPRRCAEALAAHAPDLGAAILDIGCGTGLSGLAFREAGFTTIDGIDLSPEMIEKARGRGLYRGLALADANAELPAEPGQYAHMAAVGVISPGHAPASTIDDALSKLEPGGCLVFSLNDHALADPVYTGRVMELTDCSVANLLFKEHGTHLPGIGLESTVFVLQKR